LWLVCLAVGALGFVLRYERPSAPAPPDPPILAQPLQVDLEQAPFVPPNAEPPLLEPLVPPPPPEALTPPLLLAPIAVAQPDPAIAFALPVDGPFRIVEAQLADDTVPPITNGIVPSTAASPSAQPLTFGQGEGRQPAPEYPATARRLGQEGTVGVRLLVGESGRVLSAEAVLPSPWPLLNEAATRAVRERWRFRSGPARVYEVAIRFEIVK
jgi:periplasmic protein TonB